jgi:hypothetical protein
LARLPGLLGLLLIQIVSSLDFQFRCFLWFFMFRFSSQQAPSEHSHFFRAQSISSEHSRRCSYLSVATVIFLLFIFLLFLFWFVVSLFFVLRVPLFVTTLKHKLMLVACFGSA